MAEATPAEEKLVDEVSDNQPLQAAGEKRPAETPVSGEPPEKTPKVAGTKPAAGEEKEKKEKKEKKEDKDKDKDKKEKKEKKDKDKSKVKPATPAVLDHRQLFKDGQRFLTPPVADPMRGFYESLYREHSESKVAIRYCVEYGILHAEEHAKALKRYNVLKEKGAFSAQAQMKRAIDKAANRANKAKKDKEKKEKKPKDKTPAAAGA